jgi:hypothetical protein
MLRRFLSQQVEEKTYDQVYKLSFMPAYKKVSLFSVPYGVTILDCTMVSRGLGERLETKLVDLHLDLVKSEVDFDPPVKVTYDEERKVCWVVG